jgi:DNA-binding transcriptional LysR family regulator
MGVEPRDLRWLVAAAQRPSLRQAAEALAIRQSTLSRRIRDIEARVGANLFLRPNGVTRPTIGGLKFIENAGRILEEIDAACQRIRRRSRGEYGHLRIGVCASLSTGNMHASIVESRQLAPDVDIYIVDGSYNKLLCGLIA